MTRVIAWAVATVVLLVADVPVLGADVSTATATVGLVRLAALAVAAWCLVVSVVAVRFAAVAERAVPAFLAAAVLAGPAAAQERGTATMSVLTEDEAPPAPEPAPAPPAPAPPPAAAANEWVVAPGESFWSIAEDVVGAGTTAEITAYWRTLIDANRDRLVTPDPDLVLPGQVFVLPPVSSGA